ncbi:MAG: anti-anti-sigma factor [Rhizobacter sp.]|nr:anti-anti-sigma factor [Rhizobacter sp.]
MLLLPATVTAAEARDTLRMLSQALQRVTEPGIVVDASGLQHFDSTAIAVLLECQRLAQAWGKGFSIKHPPPKLSQLATLYGVDELMLGKQTEPLTPPVA